MDLEKFKHKTEEEAESPFYYGEFIRNLFFIGGVLVLVGIPFIQNIIPAYWLFPLVGILLIILAGLTNRKYALFIFIDMLVSLFAVIVFEYFALNLEFSVHPFLILYSQFLAILFLTALYYSTRTLRGMLFK